MAKGKKRKVAPGDVATNRTASHKYEFLDKYEAGLVLQGTEVKALRESGAQLKDGFASIRDGEVWLYNVHIPPYGPASRDNHEPERPRKLLLKRSEIERLIGKTKEKGLTIVPTRLYFKGPYAKAEIALARGKDLHDKRSSRCTSRCWSRFLSASRLSKRSLPFANAISTFARPSEKYIRVGTSVSPFSLIWASSLSIWRRWASSRRSRSGSWLARAAGP